MLFYIIKKYKTTPKWQHFLYSIAINMNFSKSKFSLNIFSKCVYCMLSSKLLRLKRRFRPRTLCRSGGAVGCFRTKSNMQPDSVLYNSHESMETTIAKMSKSNGHSKFIMFISVIFQKKGSNNFQFAIILH